MFSFLQDIKLRPTYGAACGLIAIAFVLLVASNNPSFAREGGTTINLSAGASSALAWGLGILLVITGMIGAIRKGPMMAVGPFVIYCFAAEILGGSWLIPSRVDQFVYAAMFILGIAAMIMRHPFYFGAKYPLPDDASGVKQSLQNVATSMRK